MVTTGHVWLLQFTFSQMTYNFKFIPRLYKPHLTRSRATCGQWLPSWMAQYRTLPQGVLLGGAAPEPACRAQSPSRLPAGWPWANTAVSLAPIPWHLSLHQRFLLGSPETVCDLKFWQKHIWPTPWKANGDSWKVNTLEAALEQWVGPA